MKPQQDPPPAFPWRQVLILVLITVSEPLAITICFPIAPYMVGDWVDAELVGVWAGTLASAYNLSGILSNVLWGWLSDRIGRRAALASQVCGTAVMLVGFGSSGSLREALCWRVAGGIFSGIGGVSRAALREVTTEEQRGRAFSLIGWSWSIGLLLGPMIGGMLSRPADTLPQLRGTVFEARPYLLPCIASTLVCALGLLSIRWLSPPPQRAAADGARQRPAAAVVVAAAEGATASVAAGSGGCDASGQ